MDAFVLADELTESGVQLAVKVSVTDVTLGCTRTHDDIVTIREALDDIAADCTETTLDDVTGDSVTGLLGKDEAETGRTVVLADVHGEVLGTDLVPLVRGTEVVRCSDSVVSCQHGFVPLVNG
jgi:hypothetical protein